MPTNYFYSTDVLDAIEGQIIDHIGDEINEVIQFDGSLVRAITDHFQQPGQQGRKTIVFMSLSDDVPDVISGSGLAARHTLIIDLFVVARADGRSRYVEDRLRLYRVSDKLIREVFRSDALVDNTTSDYKTHVASNVFAFRRRADLGEGDYMAHVVRFEFIPRTP